MKFIKCMFISVLALFISGGLINAQQEIPESIKDKIANGINYLENAKVPSDMDKAISEFNEASAIAPDYADVHYFLGRTYSMMQGCSGKTVKEYKKYLEMYPDAPDKDKLNNEIAVLEETIKAKNTSYLLGLTLVKLPDGIYISRKNINYPGEKTLSKMSGKQPEVGDNILKINDVDLKGYSIQNAIKLIAQDQDTAGSTFKNTYTELKVKRGDKIFSVYMNKKNRKINSSELNLGEEDLATIIAKTKKPLVVFFVSDFCKPCASYNSFIGYDTKKYNNSVEFVVANLDENDFLSKEFNIDNTPTVHFYKDGKLLDKITGFDKASLISKVEELLK